MTSRFFGILNMAFLVMLIILPPAVSAEHDQGKNAADDCESCGTHGTVEPIGHDDHDHVAESADHAGHDHGAGVTLSPAQIESMGIETALASVGEIPSNLDFPGKIALNGNNVTHLTPRVSGIAIEVRKSVGDRVEKGDVLGIVDSAELGRSKLEFLSKVVELSCCSMELARAAEVNENTGKLISALRDNPSRETLDKFRGLPMGENLGTLIKTFSEFDLAGRAYRRELSLKKQNATSTREYQEAESAFRKSEADYFASLDTLSYKALFDLSEARNRRRQTDMAVLGADRVLRILGCGDAEIEGLREMAEAEPGALYGKSGAQSQSQSQSQLQTQPLGHGCSDPGCPSCLAAIGGKTASGDAGLAARLTRYALVAPFRSTIIDRHMSLGEMVGGEAAFILADLSSVWVDFSVFQADLAKLSTAMEVVISFGEYQPDVVGRVSYISPVVDESTRTATGRVILDNPRGDYRPGTFVTVRTTAKGKTAAVAVPDSAVLLDESGPILFIAEGNSFASRKVVLGARGGGMVEIKSGLLPGEKFVSLGAFGIKAKMVTSSLDSHAGHGH